ncbi:hypothetical protein KL86PLE_130532 [uncultured Pleomorphomonas sp.]|uniref:Uncharacterized protein n=1 Tax=uncultured Pleomorphomonas sp. TaxID=442121 RepID=A0A212LC44_9HYPH|nr:hypothetical protein KL86PLE_130532 [uncultured Pleomorphomonas sp.]
MASMDCMRPVVSCVPISVHMNFSRCSNSLECWLPQLSPIFSTMRRIATKRRPSAPLTRDSRQPAVTFAMVDEVHQRPEGTAGRTFHDHKHRFVEGEDFFVCDTYEASELLKRPAPNGANLLTRRGYLKLVKPLTDDRVCVWVPTSRSLVRKLRRCSWPATVKRHHQTTPRL